MNGLEQEPWLLVDTEPEGSGISEPLSMMVNLLGGLLGQANRKVLGDDILEQVEYLRLQCKKARQEGKLEIHDDLIKHLQEQDLETLNRILRSFSVYFHLVNKAEQEEIARINRERFIESGYRPESIASALKKMFDLGVSAEEAAAVINKLDIQPTFTAHPTESRRRSILLKQKNIAQMLEKLLYEKISDDERRQVYSTIYQAIVLMLVTDEVRSEKLTVKDEIMNGLYFMKSTIWKVIPKVYRDVYRGYFRLYKKRLNVSPFLRYRSWIGGDRDGNPFVTAEVTKYALKEHRDALWELYSFELNELRRELSVSSKLVAIPDTWWQGPNVRQTSNPEFLREYIIQIYQRVEAVLVKKQITGYTPELFIEELTHIQQTLVEVGLPDVAYKGRLQDLLFRAHAFRFTFSALDIRQHSGVHEQAVHELLDKAGITSKYTDLDEAEKIQLLSKELKNPRPLIHKNVSLSDITQEALTVFDVIREAQAIDPGAIGSYIISMTHDQSDMLEVLLLAKEAGIWHFADGIAQSSIDVAPLLETVEDLTQGELVLEEIFQNPVYRAQLKSRNDFQEIMLGYSDSNKDGGYFMANWALHKAQRSLALTCKKQGIDFRLFHGRGGSVGRGGGRANKAISAMPVECQNGRIRVTEQGEVITFRYALPQIAHRHLEQVVSAMLTSTTPACQSLQETFFDNDEDVVSMMEGLAKESMESYRSFVLHPQFWDWYSSVTPIAHISRLKIASRPVSRAKNKKVDLGSIRAIPWNFAWTQTRYNVPGWYGIGKALARCIEDESQLKELQKMYKSWIYFRAIINNATRELARSEHHMASFYSKVNRDESLPDFHQLIIEEAKAARAAILKITKHETLLSHSPVIEKSIELRNPYTDVLNLIQIELIHRWNENKGDNEELGRTILLSINGLAAAMQSTG